MKHLKAICKSILKGAAAAALLLAAPAVEAQDFYVIKAGTNILAHNTDLNGGLANTTTFNVSTCLWTISGSSIIAISPDGTTGYYLSYVNGNNYGVSLRNDGNYNAWSSGIIDGGEPYVSANYNTYYLRYRNSAWGVSNNTTHGVLTKLNVSDAPNTSSSTSTTYSATIDGDGVIYTTSGTHTYTADVMQTITYAQTTRTFSGYATTGTTSVTINKPYPVSTAYTGALTNVNWSVSPTTYGNINSSTGELTISSLPTDVASITITYNAQADGQAVSGSMQVILAKDESVAEGRVGQTTGVSGGVVTLNDYEDHSWSFYSDATCPIRSLNPANVKITYNGNGTGTVQTNNNDTPSSWGANATGVKVGIDADASTFIYYETLERTNGRGATSASAADGRCSYTTIANPFSVRPTYDSDGTSKYRGFYAWRVKTLTGGTIHSAATGGTSYTVGSTINAETEIFFAPTSEYGMAVEFEALWARAYVSTTGVPNNSLGVERNFYVITASATSNITAGNNPCTYTSIYPNGTTNGTTAATDVTVYKYGGFTASADSKIEYIILRNNGSTVNANGKNFTIGRGVSGYNGGLCATNLYGLNGTATSSFRFNFASGRFANLYFCGDGRTMSSGILTSVIGCDYDRAMGDNSKLKITTDIIAGHNGTGGSNGNEGADFLRCTVKSGNFDLGDYGGGAQFYLSLWGNTGSGTYGKKTMVIEGGVFSDISGGIDVEDNQVSAADMLEIRMKGGTVNGVLYGAAQYAASYGNRHIIITGGTLKGWVAGGANGTQTTGGKLTGDTYVYFGGDARCDSEGATTTMGKGNATGGNIFGAGSGNSNADAGEPVGEVNNSTVVIADDGYVERNVYGGGNYGYVCSGTGHKSDILVMGGTVNGKVFGGSNNQNGQIVNINMKGGTVVGGVYGGSNASGTVAGPVSVNILGGTVGASSINPTNSETGHVFGSGYGSGTSISGNVTVTIGATSSSHSNSPLIYGNVYGGGHNAAYTSNNNTFWVKGYNGLVKGSIFGGGKGTSAIVTGDTDVQLQGYISLEGNVFGGGDAATVTGNTKVTIQD